MKKPIFVLLIALLFPATSWAVITDNFNHASPVGAGWEVLTGGWDIIGSTVAKPTSQYTFSYMRRSEASFPNDQFAEANVQFVTGAGDLSSENGPAVRMDGSGNSYFANIDSTTTKLVLNKKVAGVVMQDIADDNVTTYTAATNYLVRVTVTGTTITVSVNGVTKITTTDTDLTSGKPGLFCLTGQTSFIPPFDDFQSTDASGAGGGNVLQNSMGFIGVIK